MKTYTPNEILKLEFTRPLTSNEIKRTTKFVKKTLAELTAMDPDDKPVLEVLFTQELAKVLNLQKKLQIKNTI